MKIEKFLLWIQHKLLYYPDISVQTVKMFIDKFASCLSNTEIKRNSLTIATIKEFSLKQISLDSFVLDNKIKILDDKLNNLKKDD